MSITQENFVLSNGVKMPKLGIGTYKLQPGDETYHAVLTSLKLGIRHIDTAIVYHNEISVGQAIRDSGIPREDLFVTSKLPPHIKNHQGVMRMFERSLKNLGLDYIDAYIINAPAPFGDTQGNYDQGNIEAYQALERLYKEERVLAIGVSQFQIKDLSNILTHCDIVPHIQQISFFIGHTQDALVAFCKSYDIQIQAFSPLAKGYLLKHDHVIQMALKYGVTSAQLALRYVIEKEVAPIPKASQESHIHQNTQLDFTLTDEDIKILDDIVDDPRQYDDNI
jgi:diketogulonate reductase-like aldo/keto reductase